MDVLNLVLVLVHLDVHSRTRGETIFFVEKKR